MSETTPQAWLEAVIDSQPRRFLLNTGSSCRIGRSDQNTIVLLDNQVSRNHAMIQCTEKGEFYLSDLGSRNGTYLNQRLITAPVMLHAGDRVSVGHNEFLFHCNRPSERVEELGHGETAAEFSQQLITVLVADIRDFTGLSRRIGETKLSEIVSAFMRQAGAVLRQQGAWGQKYIGDAVMAIWVHRSDRPSLREMSGVFRGLERLFEIAAELHVRFGLDAPIHIGAGVNTGLACLGNMGSGAAADYTALSDAVNLAFRLESATKQIGCEIAAGRRTYEFLAAEAGAGPLFQSHALELKGYQQPVPVFAVRRDALGALLERLQQPESEPTRVIHV